MLHNLWTINHESWFMRDEWILSWNLSFAKEAIPSHAMKNSSSGFKDEEINFSAAITRFIRVFGINKVKLSNGKVALAPSLCGENCFRVIRDMSDCISFPDERNESLLVIFKKPIWPPSGNKNRYREYGIENLPHEAPGAPKIFRFERLNIFSEFAK